MNERDSRLGAEDDSEADSIRRLWLAGLCPCCGSELNPWTGLDGVEHLPETIGEEVMFCGRCMGNHHYIEAADYILKILAEGKL